MSNRQSTQPEGPSGRGIKKTNPLGTALFVGLRNADIYVQYGILAYGWGSGFINLLGGTTLPHGLTSRTGTLLNRLQLSPYRLILLSMAAGSAFKQSVNAVGIFENEFKPSMAVGISALNTFFNSVNDLFFVCSRTSASVNGEHFPQTPLIVGSALYVAGITCELLAEVQRKRFKDDARNRGKAYTGGLFALSRHVNYFGFVLWRAGYAMAAGGWLWGGFIAAFHGYDFVARAIPELDTYCSERVSGLCCECVKQAND